MKPDSSRSNTDVPLVSIVIPTRNRRDILERCLEALASQTYSNYEIIVVDDASTDDTPDLVARFMARHPDLNIRALRNETHAGANASRNRGVREANGEWVAFEDSDCIADPHWIEKLVGGFTSQRVAAVTGLVKDQPPKNIYERTFQGTHRLARAGPAHRLVAGNMGARRELLLEFLFDEDRVFQPVGAKRTPGVAAPRPAGCDEEGLFLMLRAAGYQQRVVPDAVVLHEHCYTGRSFFRQAFQGGQAAARLVYKYYLPPRLDMAPFLLTYLTLPLVLLNRWLGLIPAFFLAAAIAAIVYNDLFRKGKTLGETIVTFPVLLGYYHVRLAGYAAEAAALRLGRRMVIRRRLPRGPVGSASPNAPKKR